MQLFIYFCARLVYILLRLMFISQHWTCLCEMFMWNVFVDGLCGVFMWNVYLKFLYCSHPHVYFTTSDLLVWNVCMGCLWEILCGMFIWNVYQSFSPPNFYFTMSDLLVYVYEKYFGGMFIWNVYQSFSPPHVYFVTSDLFVWKPFHWRPAGEVSLVWYQGQSPNLEK